MRSLPLSGPFDPMASGTEEAAWTRLLSGCPDWQPTEGPLLVVAPHPDDEVLGAGGLMHCWAARGRPVALLSVSDGEAAYPGSRALGSVRREELRQALRKLCTTHVAVTRLGLPDGDIGRHENKIRNAVLSLWGAGATLVAPYECDGHPDHDAVGRVCVDVARAHAISLVRYPIWTWHRAAPDSLRHMQWVRFTLEADALRAKARAIQCFASQISPEDRDPIVPPHVLRHFARPYEAFIV